MSKYKTMMGFEVEVTTLPMMLIDKINAAHPDPDVPTYEIPASALSPASRARHFPPKDTGPDWMDYLLGLPGAHDYSNETTIRSSEDKQAWLDYLKQKASAQTERNRAFMRLVMLRMKVSIPDDDTWIREQRLLGVTAPDDPIERRLHYIETEVMGGHKDYEEIARLTMGEMGVSEEAISQAEAAFRRPVAGTNTIESAKSKAGELDVQQ